MKIFLGSVPFGCDNIGDEAILEAIVKILRRNFDNPQICVATAKPEETSKLLNCKAVGLLGFGNLDKNQAQTIEAIKECNLYIWAGATGLSDYPEAGLVGLELAQKFGKKTILWNVGMNDNLNPVFFKVSGKKKLLCDIASKLCFNLVDFCKLWETQKIKKIEKKLLKSLKKCEFIALRDEESLARLKKFGEFKNAIVGADSVLILDDYSDGDLNCLTSKTKQALLSEGEKIGVCISSQRKIKDLEGFVKAFDNLLNKDNRKLFLIPMNEKTDLPLMKEVFENAKNKDKIFPLEGANERRTIMAAASKCDVIISSRLHLLILSANVSTPIEGISRGSKIANFLNNFGKKPVGSVDKCDFYVLAKEIEKDIVESSIFKNTRLNAYKSFTQKINECEKLFKKLQF